MRVNCHAHIFSLHTVLTRKTISILVDRLTQERLPDFVISAVEDLLVEQLDHPELLVEEDLLTRLLKKIKKNSGFKKFVKDQQNNLPLEVRILGSMPVETLGSAALRSILDKLSTAIDRQDGDANKSTFFDIVQTLRLCLQPSAGDVAEKLLAHLDPDDLLVSLMMDITAGDNDDRDEQLFMRQLRENSEAVLRFPGRILPFYCVNPVRKDTLTTLKQAVEQMGFVGVKLYPSLGYSVDTPEMQEVYDYCREMSLPIVVHCTHGGFYASTANIGLCDPSHWLPVLNRNPDLRLCVAHFGGAQGLVGPAIDPNSWTGRILTLMKDFQGVYTDVSYHVQMMGGGDAEKNYFRHLKGFLQDGSPYQKRILFGTDGWLVRMRLTEEHFWQYFQSHLTPKEFSLISEIAPRAFLNLPDQASKAGGPNVERYCRFVHANHNRVGAEPAPWLKSAIDHLFGPTVFTVTRVDSRWSKNNEAHKRTYEALFDQLYPVHRTLPFDQVKDVRLRQLQYWNKEHETATIFNRKCKKLAQDVDAYIRATGARGETGQSVKETVTKLAEFFSDGDKTLAELAGFVDALYRFGSEVV
jgi:predicted TIM-barrel fold metal-dependent hydrolase